MRMGKLGERACNFACRFVTASQQVAAAHVEAKYLGDRCPKETISNAVHAGTEMLSTVSM